VEEYRQAARKMGGGEEGGARRISKKLKRVWMPEASLFSTPLGL